MTEREEPRINPDPPYSPGTPEPPNLDVDVEQFMDDRERPAGQDVTEDDEEPA
ncbi:hypothetical protein [Lentzea tibetensis]|uniref:hypothetical protein n=1 Tax=Lentzea tibetensis TaxID=2591470 RepID=UPI001644554B|nr:hypothetical protein [Lentzea tibetensis]